jgi:hypothetical protein
MVIEKIVFVEKPAPAPMLAAVPAPKKKVPHLRAVPPMSLPLFEEPKPEPIIMPGLEVEERAKLSDLLDELQGLKARLRQARA